MLRPRNSSSRSAALAVLVFALVFAGALPAAAPAATLATEHDSTFANDWMRLVVERVKADGYSPLVASRIYAYAGVTLYETALPGMPGYQTMAGQLHELPALPQPPAGVTIDWPAAVSAAAAAVTRGIFPNASAASLGAFRDLYMNHNLTRLQDGVSRSVLQDSRMYGNQVADAILAWAAADGYADSRGLPYTPPDGPGQWVPTGGSANPLPLEPYWGTLRTFVIPSPDTCAPAPPTEFSEEPGSPFFQEAQAVYDAWVNLTPEQRVIANFWADNPRQTGTPPGHSVSATLQLVEGRNLAEAVEAYALVGVAVGDAFIACWWTKYHYNLVRPETYIRHHIDAGWTPLISTPPFPEYTSGHSVQSGATNSVLVALFGDGPFVDETHAARGLAPRAFDSLSAAFEEAAVSRLYGGIHYPIGIDEGVPQGRCIGQTVVDSVQTRN